MKLKYKRSKTLLAPSTILTATQKSTFSPKKILGGNCQIAPISDGEIFFFFSKKVIKENWIFILYCGTKSTGNNFFSKEAFYVIWKPLFVVPLAGPQQVRFMHTEIWQPCWEFQKRMIFTLNFILWDLKTDWSLYGGGEKLKLPNE